MIYRLILSPKNNENINRMDTNNKHSNDFVEMYSTSSPVSISNHKHVLKPKNNVVNVSIDLFILFLKISWTPDKNFTGTE